MIYTVTFNPALDYILYTDGLQTGETNRAVKEAFSFGGKGINVSFVLKELGIPNIALGFIAGFTGEELARQVKQAGLKTDLISLKSGNTRVNVKLKGTDETEINAKGPVIDREALLILFEKLRRLQEGDTLVLAGSIPPSLPADIYAQIAEVISVKNVRLAVDTAGDGLKKVLPYRPFLIKPNRRELEELAGKPLLSQQAVAAAAAELQQRGARNVLVSLGAEGAMLLTEGGVCLTHPAMKGTAVNTVGAGDSMVAGFLVGIEKGEEYALRLGIAAGCASAFSEGLATRAEIQALLNRWCNFTPQKCR